MLCDVVMGFVADHVSVNPDLPLEESFFGELHTAELLGVLVTPQKN